MSNTFKSRSIEGKKKGFIKIHVAVNIKTGEVSSLIIADDRSSR